MKYRFLLLTLMLQMTAYCQNLCTINELNVSISDCHNDGTFFVTINFQHGSTSDNFKVLGNGHNYGTFQYSALPITIGPLLSDCSLNYEFVVRDNVFENCSAFKNVGPVCCHDMCSIEFVNVEAGDCNGSVYPLHFNLSHANAPDNGFDLYNNGQHYGYYQYSQLPLNFPDFPSSPTDTYNKIVVCVNDRPNCCDTLLLLNPCICTIYRVQGQVVNCNPETGTFDLKLNFKHNLSADSFQIGGNSVSYGTFAYSDLPVTINNLHFSPTLDYEFLIVDKNDEYCFAVYPLGIVNECNFNCSITDVTAIATDCVDGKFYVDIDFNYKNTSLAGFTVRGNGQIYDTLEYGEPHYRIGPLTGDCHTLYEFAVVDRELECRGIANFTTPVCCTQPCGLSELVITENCENNQLIGYSVNFNHTGMTGNFILKVNNIVVGTFPYANLPIKINNISFNAPNAVFDIIDAQNEMCHLHREYTFQCSAVPPCSIFDMVVMPSGCNEDNKFFGILKFKVNHPGNLGFVVKVNGQIVDTLQYGQNAYEIGPLAGDCHTIYEFVVADREFECKAVFIMTIPVCCPNNCPLNNLVVTEHCENNQLNGYAINFSHTGLTGNFVLKVNNVIIGTFPYANLPIQLNNIGFTSGSVVFDIIDTQNEMCRLHREYTFQCTALPPCSIFDMVVMPSGCNADNKFFGILKFKVNHPGNQGFLVKVNGQIVDTLEYGHDAYEIGPLAGDCHTIYEFVVVDRQFECRAVFHMTLPVCCPNNCPLNNLVVTEHCENNQLTGYAINFSHTGLTGNFVLKVNNVVIGTFPYANLPIQINNISFDAANVVFDIIDTQNEMCRLHREYTFQCTSLPPCSIFDMVVMPSGCNADNKFFGILKFKVNHPGNQGFLVKVNGQIIDTLEYGHDVYEIGPLAGDCHTIYEFVVVDRQFECRAVFHMTTPVCCPGNCLISELVITEHCENNHLVSFDVNFHHTTQTGNFSLKINNTIIGTFNYANLPLHITNINFDLPNTVFTIIDSGNEACRLVREYKFQCFATSQCNIFDLTATASDCNPNNIFYAILKFKVTAPGNHGFIVKINGQTWDTLEYGLAQYQVGPLNCDCNTFYKFTVEDVVNHACSDEFTFTEKICMPAACNINNPVVSFSACEGGKFNVTLNFDHISTTQKFRIKINGVIKGPFNYIDLPIHIENLSERQSYEIIVWDTEKESCRTTFSIPAIECPSATEDTGKGSVVLINNNQYLTFIIEEHWLPSNIKIFDMAGRLLYAQKAAAENQIDISQFIPGLYLIQLSNQKQIVTKKFIRQ